MECDSNFLGKRCFCRVQLEHVQSPVSSAINAWAGAHNALKLSGEVALVTEAAVEGNLGQREIGVEEKSASFVDPYLANVLGGREVELAAELALEGTHGESTALGEIGNSQLQRVGASDAVGSGYQVAVALSNGNRSPVFASDSSEGGNNPLTVPEWDFGGDVPVDYPAAAREKLNPVLHYLSLRENPLVVDLVTVHQIAGDEVDVILYNDFRLGFQAKHAEKGWVRVEKAPVAVFDVEEASRKEVKQALSSLSAEDGG